MKKMHYKSLVAAAILTGLSQQAAIATELEPLGSAQDTWVRSPTLDTKKAVFANKNFMKIDRSYSAFVQFVIPALPEGEIIDTVVLKLTANTAIPDTYIATITDPDVVWDETVVNELVYPFVVDSIISGTAITGILAGDVKDFDVTTAVSGAGTYTFNINMEDKDAGNISWKSGIIGSGNAERPHLFITTKLAVAADEAAPVFTDIGPISINATGVKTDISSLINITATDETDADPIAATIVGDSSLTSGAHTVTLQATDAAGNQATKEVTVNIKPLVILTAPETLLLPAGSSATATVSLSGPAVSYPATVDYTVTGDAATADSGTLTFENPSAKNVEIVLLGSATNEQTAVLTLTATSNVQTSSETVTITAFEGNAAPSVSLTLMQADKTIATISASNADVIPYIDATKGDVTVTVVVQDFNDEDTHDIAWTNTSEALAATGTSFVFSPAELSGEYTLSASATETNTSDKFSSKAFAAQIKVIATALPELVADVDSDKDGIPDTEEGFKDSDGDGIVDYLDDNADTTQLPLADGQKSLQTLPGLTLSLGSISAAQGIEANSAVITLADLAASVAADSADTTDSGFLPIEGASLFNFTINGLTTAGDTAPVVYPLPKDVVIGAETEYRKYTPAAGWTTFVSDADNAIASAAKDETGNCPAPESELYIDGLTAGDGCIQLTIKDGGIYDADGLENSSIEDPGVLAESFELIQWAKNTIALGSNDVNEGSTVTLTKDLTTLVGDADVSALTFTVEGDASWITIDEAGVLTADLSKLASGDHTADVSFTSENEQTGTTTVSVSVAFNSAPKLATVELAAASRNEAYSASIADSITDAESDSYTIEKVSGPYWLKVSETGELSGTPLKANIGDNNVTVKLTDDKGASSEVSFNVPVSDSNVRASDGGSFSAGLLAMLALVSLRRRKAQK